MTDAWQASTLSKLWHDRLGGEVSWDLTLRRYSAPKSYTTGKEGCSIHTTAYRPCIFTVGVNELFHLDEKSSDDDAGEFVSL